MSNADLGTATYRIIGDASGAVNASGQANASLVQLGSSVAQNWWGLQNLARAFEVLPAAVAAGTGSAIKSAVEWQDALAGIETKLYDSSLSADQNSKALGRLSGQLLDLAKTRPVATVKIAGVAELAAQLGVAKGDIAEFTKQVIDLSQTGDITANSAATALARIAALTNVSADGYKNIASAILVAGRSTLATEDQVAGLSQSLAGAAKSFQIPADKLIGISAALASVGAGQQLAGTTVQKVFIAIDSAITQNGKKLIGWANLANQTKDQFVKGFREDAGGTFVKIIEGLARAQAGHKNFNGTLKDLGVGEGRQVKLLSLLAAAQNSTAQGSVKLSDIVKDTSKAFNDGTAITQTAEARYKTFSAQVQILRNDIFAMAEKFGTALLPALQEGAKVLDLLIRAFTALPGPIKITIAIFVALLAVASAFVALSLILVGRLALTARAISQVWPQIQKLIAAFQTWRETGSWVVKTTEEETGALEQQAVAAEETAAQIEILNERYAEMIAAQKAALGETEASSAGMVAASGKTKVAAGETNAALTETEVAGGAAAGGLATTEVAAFSLGSVLSGLAGKLFAVFAAFTVGDFIQNLFAGHTKTTTDRVNEQGHAIGKLVDAYKAGDAAASKTIATWIRQQITEKKLADSAKSLGISRSLLNSVINGTASSSQYDAFIAKVLDGDKKGVSGAREFGTQVEILAKQIGTSKDKALSLGASYDFVANNGKKAANSLRDMAQATEEDAAAATKAVQAHLDYIDAMFSAQTAAFDVHDAEIALQAARRNSGVGAENVAKAEIDLARARLSASQSSQNITNAEQNLAKARLDQSQADVKAEAAVADAKSAHADAVQSVIDKEQALQDLKSVDYTNALAKSEHELRDALQSVSDNVQKAKDAQWQLNYLREEGAGKRDILKAQSDLANANNAVADSVDKAKDAQKAHDQLADPAKHAAAIAKAERDLAAARRAVVATAQAENSAELDLIQTRQNVASNSAVLSAENALATARLDGKANALAVRDAERALADARAAANNNDVAKAELAYEQSLYRQAQALAEVKKQQELMKGNEFTAADQAKALKKQLEGIANSLPDGSPVKRNLEHIIKLLSNVPKIPEIAGDLGPDASNVPTAPKASFGDDQLAGLQKSANNPSMWNKIKRFFDKHMTGIFAGLGALFGPTIAGAIGGGEVGAFAGPLGILIGAIVGIIVGLLIHFGPQIAKALWGFVKHIPHYLGVLAKAIGGVIEKIPYAIGYALGFILKIVVAAIKWLVDHVPELTVQALVAFVSLIDGIYNAIKPIFTTKFWDAVWHGIQDAWKKLNSPKTWEGFGKAILHGLKSAGSWLVDVGNKIIGGVWKGFEKAYPEGAKWLQKLPGRLLSFFGTAISWLSDAGGKVIGGLLNGIKTGFLFVAAWFIGLPDVIGRFFLKAVSWLVGVGGDVITGLWNGIKFVWGAVTSWFGGIGDQAIHFIKSGLGMVHSAESKIYHVGKDIIQGLWNGVRDKWNDFKSWLSNKIKDLPKAFLSFFGIKSPSTLMHYYGKMIGQGLHNGLKESMDQTTKMFNDTMKAINPDALALRFKGSNLDPYVVNAYMSSGQLTDMIVSGGIGSSSSSSVIHHSTVNDSHDVLQLEAKTDATPAEIFGQFRWEQNLRFRGKTRR